MLDSYDLVVLGAGNAGLAAANAVRAAGHRVLVVEARDVGGTCPLRGCVPKKVLVAAAETLDVIARAPDKGIDVGPVKVDWGRVIDRKESILAGTSEGIEADLAVHGVDLAKGHARFTGPGSVAIGERAVRAKNVLVATGSVPRPLPIPGAERLVTSDDLLDLRAPPASLVFVGAGVIAFELAHVFARLGTKITMLEVAPRPLGNFDEDAVDRLVEATRALGIDVITGARIHAIEPQEGGFATRFEAGGEERTIVAERVAHGAGRVPALDGLDLAAAKVRVEHGGIVIGAPYNSASNRSVWVAGDALRDTPQLSPVATAEGKLAARAILGEDVELDYLSIPSCVYSVPALATVGRTEREARDAGLRFTVKTNDMSGWKSGRTYAERFAWAKVLVGSDDRLVGAHVLGHESQEIIHAFALALKYGLRAKDLRDFVWAYPTHMSDVKYLV
jgi:glutathione reductase (NADPH)